MVDIVPDMARPLAETLPGVDVIKGDARRLADLVPRARRGRSGTVVCGTPLVLLPVQRRGQPIMAMQAVARGRGFLHYRRCILSSLPAPKHDLVARRKAWTPLNLQPASVWRYDPA